MCTPSRKCGSVFYPSLSPFNEDHNKEYPLTKFKQFYKCGYVVLSTFNSISLYMEFIICKEVKKEGSKQVNKQVIK